MTIRKGLYGIALAGLLASPLTFAGGLIQVGSDGTNSECGILEIQIANMTDKVCVLSSKTLIHGSKISGPPIAILPGDSKAFVIEQTMIERP